MMTASAGHNETQASSGNLKRRSKPTAAAAAAEASAGAKFALRTITLTTFEAPMLVS